MSPLTVILIFLIFIALLFFIMIIKKLIYRYKYKKRYFIIPHVSSKGVTNIGMMIALTVTIIMFLMIVTANVFSVIFRAWAGSRVLIEGILIKIGGLLFGPIIGMCLGVATDFLTVAITGGIFHYGYLIAAAGFGLIGGIVRSITNMSKSKNINFAIYSTILIVGLCGTVIALVYESLLPDTGSFTVDILSYSLTLTLNQIILILSLFAAITVLIVWVSYFVYIWWKKKYPKKENWFLKFIPVLIVIVLSEILINVLMMPAFDATISTLGYNAWFTIRVLLLIPSVLLNIAIIFPIFKVIGPIVKYNYEDELIEQLNKPLEID